MLGNVTAYANGKGEKPMRVESACFLAHPAILLDDVKEGEGSRKSPACGGTSSHKWETVKEMSIL